MAVVESFYLLFLPLSSSDVSIELLRYQGIDIAMIYESIVVMKAILFKYFVAVACNETIPIP